MSNDSCNCSASCSCKEGKCCSKKCCCFLASTFIISFLVSLFVGKCIAYKTVQKYSQQQVEIEMLKNIIEIKTALANKDVKNKHIVKSNKNCVNCKK